MTYGLEGRCSIHLSYGQYGKLERYKKSLQNAKRAVNDNPFFYWSEYKDSNLGPPGPKPGALPGCATLRSRQLYLKQSRRHRILLHQAPSLLK